MTQHWYCSRTGCVGMGMCCEKMMMIDSAKKCMVYEVGGPRPRGRPKRTWREVVREDCQALKMNKVDAFDRCKWRKMIKDVRWSGRVWVGECFFWYRPTRVVLDKRPLNGCVCVCSARIRGIKITQDIIYLVNKSIPSVVNILSIIHTSIDNNIPIKYHTRPRLDK